MIKEKKTAFTLIEIVMGVVLIILIAYGLGVFIVKGIDAWVLLRARNTLQGESRVVMMRMLDEFRKIPDTSNITTAGTSECEFSDADGNTYNFKLDTSGSDYILSYNYNAGGAVSLSDNLTSDGLQFTYLDGSGNPTFIISDIRAVRIGIKLTREDEHFEIQSACRLRVVQ